MRLLLAVSLVFLHERGGVAAVHDECPGVDKVGSGENERWVKFSVSEAGG